MELAALDRAPRVPFASMDAFLAAWRAGAAEQPSSAARASLGGAMADRVACAFAAGYAAAVQALAPRFVPPGSIACLCASEERGAHPRAIATRYEAGRLHGKKQWATLGPLADALLVVASTGVDDSGRNRLVVVRVHPGAPGVSRSPMPEPPFAPEAPHAAIALDDVAVDPADLLPGDGYDAYVKPFRTIEDAHVLAALSAYVLRCGRARGWPESTTERALLVALAAQAVAALPPSEPSTHLALAGLFEVANALLADADAHFARAEAADEEATRWRRDRALLGIAERARAERRTAAWKRLREG